MKRVHVAVAATGIPAWHRTVVESIGRVAAVSFVADPASADLIVNLSGEAIAATARCPVWRYGFGDGAPFARGAAGTLARLYSGTADHDRVRILREGWFKRRSAESAGTPDVGDRVARWCADRIEHVGFAPADEPTGTLGGGDAWMPPQDHAVGDLVSAWRRWRRREHWTIGVAASPLPEILDRQRLGTVSWIRAGSDRVFLADPFPIAREDGVTRLLAEEYDRGAARGRIVALHTGDGGDVRSRTVWMDAGHHLSYPFVFTAGGAAQCIPEAASTRRVTSYDLDSRTPHVLIDRFAAADPTITEHEDHWYLFCTNRDDEPQTDLHLFVAENWRGPWRPHPRNPVKSDARSSRPAGACFRLADALFRPAQDCSRRYGGGLVINRVTALSPTMFREQTVCTLDADAASPWPHGVHTINGCGPVTWVDGLRVDGL